MGLFNAFKKLGGAVFNTVLLPIDVAIDSVTLGGVITESESKISRRLKKIGENASEAYEETFEDND